MITRRGYSNDYESTKGSYSDDYKRKGNYYKIKLIHSNFLNLVHFQPTFFILF